MVAPYAVGPEVVENLAGAVPYLVLIGPNGMWGPDTEFPRQNLEDSTVCVLPFGRGQRFGENMSRGLNYADGGLSASGIFTRPTGLPFSISLLPSGTVSTVSYSSYTNTQGNSGSKRGVRTGPTLILHKQQPGTGRRRILQVVAGSTWRFSRIRPSIVPTKSLLPASA